MNKIQCTNVELVNMLVIIEKTLKSSRGSILAMEWTSSKKKLIEKKNKSAKKQKVENKMKKDISKKKTIEKQKYFHYNKDGHWKQNYPSYLVSLKNKKEGAPSKGMLIIKSNLIIFSTSSWMIDSGSSAHLGTFM